MALSLPNNFRGLLAPIVDDFQNDEDRQKLLKGGLESLSKQGLTTQAAAARRLFGENQLLTYTLEASFGMNVGTVAEMKQMRQQLDTQTQVIERLEDKIGRKDEAYLNALTSPLFTARPESTNAEVLEVASSIIKYSKQLQERKKLRQ